MRTTKTKLTFLSERIKKTLPEEGELLEFAGINRDLILKTLDHSYSTVTLIDEFGDTFEVVLLKKRIATLIDYANKYLKENWEDQSKEEFNDFLIDIADLNYLTASTYTLLSNQDSFHQVEAIFPIPRARASVSRRDATSVTVS